MVKVCWHFYYFGSSLTCMLYVIFLYFSSNFAWLCHRYLRCCPLVAKLSKQKNVHIHRLSDLLRSFWPKKKPKLVMFGPGLESSTSLIVRKILDGHSDLFTVISMFPGQFGGMIIFCIFLFLALWSMLIHLILVS